MRPSRTSRSAAGSTVAAGSRVKAVAPRSSSGGKTGDPAVGLGIASERYSLMISRSSTSKASAAPGLMTPPGAPRSP